MKTRLLLSCIAALSLNAQAKNGWQEWFRDGLGDAQVVSGTAIYKVENGTLIGTTVDSSPNTFLMKGLFKDFELQFEVKVDDQLNSGVQVRSHLAKDCGPSSEGRKGGKPLPAGSPAILCADGEKAFPHILLGAQ